MYGPIYTSGIEIAQTADAPPAGAWDLTTWSATDWAGVLGFLLSVAIALFATMRAAIRWWRSRLKLRRQVIHIPGRYRPDNNSDRYEFVIHHDSGPQFRVEKVLLRLSHPAAHEDDQRRWEEKFGRKGEYAQHNPIAFPATIRFQLSGIDNENTNRPLFAAGESLHCAGQLNQGWPWELVDPAVPFARIELYSMGRVLESWDASEELRASVPMYVEWRRGNGQTIRAVPRQDIPYFDDRNSS